MTNNDEVIEAMKAQATRYFEQGKKYCSWAESEDSKISVTRNKRGFQWYIAYDTDAIASSESEARDWLSENTKYDTSIGRHSA